MLFLIFVNDPVNFRDLWGLDTVDVSFAFKFDATEKNIYYDNYGRPSFDPHVVNGFNVGERSVVEQKSNKTTTVQIFSDNTIVVTSSSSTKIGVIIFDGTFNENNAEKGTVKMYDISCSSITITSTTTAVASAPIVSGGNDYNRTQHGIYLDIKKENIMEVSGSKVLRDGNHGDYYYRLNKVTGEALHLGNQTVNIDYQKTEGCSAITGLNEEEIRKNNDILLDQGDDCATFIVF